MVTRDTPWDPGTPCWVELITNDVPAARLFYEELFGWQMEDTGAEYGNYVLPKVDGRSFGGISAPMGDPAHPPVWTTYLATADAAATAQKVKDAGGKVLMGPMDVMTLGVMLVAQDPTGATICFWQAGDNPGMQIANEPNTPTWNELLTRDYRRAQEFFTAVFGYTYDEVGNDEFQYSTFQVGGRGVGGMGSMPPGVPDRVPAHWRVYFEVEDPDEIVDRVVKLGGTVINPPEDSPFGRMARVADPQGAPVSVIHGQDPSS